MTDIENKGVLPDEFAIELIEVEKRFGETIALHSVSLEIQNGEFLILLGPSGCGKSTILRIISGLEDATQGEVYIKNQLVNYMAPKERDVAMVFQNYALYPHMTVERNIGFPLEMSRVQKDKRHEQVVEVAKFLEIGELLERYPEQLSGGQRQRVALGRALIRDPIAFLLDEPLSNLDALLRVQMRDELLKLHRRIQKTTLYVTHDQVEAMTMADRIVILKEGVIQQIGNPEEVYMQPANTFVATFVGSPQMNLFEGNIEKSEEGYRFQGPFGLSLGKRFQIENGESKVSLGIRPEDIAVVTDEQPETISGEIVLVEPIGSDTFLNVDIAQESSLKVRVPASFTVQEGSLVRLQIAAKDVHLFDADCSRIASVL